MVLTYIALYNYIRVAPKALYNKVTFTHSHTHSHPTVGLLPCKALPCPLEATWGSVPCPRTLWHTDEWS